MTSAVILKLSNILDTTRYQVAGTLETAKFEYIINKSNRK